MFKTKCWLPIFALFISHVNSWDIALTHGSRLEFFTSGTNSTVSVHTPFTDLTALAYDAVHNMLLFVDKQSDNASIFSYNLATKKDLGLVRRNIIENIQGIAFDPITGQLFWTDSDRRGIYSKSLKDKESNQSYGKLLIGLKDQFLRAIAVDSCRGYIYWTNLNMTNPTIERARFDGTDRKIIISSGLAMPISLAIDQRTRSLIWADDAPGIHYTIQSSDLDGNNRKILVSHTHYQPMALAVSKDSIYWLNYGSNTVFRIRKGAESTTELETFVTFMENDDNRFPFGIVTNYTIADQTEGIPECENLLQHSQTKAVINESLNIPSDAGLFCLHGVKIPGELACKCSPEYTGQRCEIPVCQNYCVHGICSVNSKGQPQCRCKENYTGDKCEMDICYKYCLHEGRCSVKNGSPVCTCLKQFEGDRCETLKQIAKPEYIPIHRSVSEPCNCTEQISTVTTDEFVPSCSNSDGWDSVRDPILMVLGALSGLLILLCAVLITKILQLKKRPRIKKRIIVNKNVTPLTARPDQCEITIENCCNMNICETPCFEPRSTIRPTLLDAKPGKEEKRNLIANMEYPDDY